MVDTAYTAANLRRHPRQTERIPPVAHIPLGRTLRQALFVEGVEDVPFFVADSSGCLDE